jgi:hypothetical protein
MTAIYAAALKTARMQLVADQIVGGSLVIGDGTLSGATGVLATITLPSPAATVSGSTLTISGTPLNGTGSANGTPLKAELRNSSGTAIVTGLAVGAEIILNSSSISSGGTLTLTSGTIAHG